MRGWIRCFLIVYLQETGDDARERAGGWSVGLLHILEIALGVDRGEVVDDVPHVVVAQRRVATLGGHGDAGKALGIAGGAAALDELMQRFVVEVAPERAVDQIDAEAVQPAGVLAVAGGAVGGVELATAG